MMRAILLAAGLGTRLRPLTNKIPKCLVPIKGKPLLEIWLERLTQAGVGRFLINTHYLPEQVEELIKVSHFTAKVELIYESELQGTAGTLSKNLSFFQGKEGLLIHADNYCLADMLEFQRAHLSRPPECKITMMTFRTDQPSSCGIVELNKGGIVTGFHEKVKNPPGNIANGAIYILSQEFLGAFNERFLGAKDFSCDVIPKLLGEIYTYETNEPLVDIGTIEAYSRL